MVDSNSPTIDCLLRDVFQGFWPWESHVPCIGPIQPGDKVPSVAFNPIVEICCYVVEEASDYEGGYDARGRGEDGVKRTCSVESFGHFPFSGSVDELCAKSEVDWVCPPFSATVDVDDVVHYSEDNLDLCSDAHRLLNPDLVCPVVRDDIPVWLCRSEGLVDPPAFVVERDHEEVEIDDAPSEEDAYVVIDNWLVVEQALQDFDLDPTRPLPVVTFGLHGIGIGRRDTYIISMDPHHLREALWELWADAVPPNAVAVAFFVTPQPLQELQIDQGLVLVVQIDPPNVEPFDYRPSLMMQCSMNGVLLQEPSACYLSAVTSRDELQSRHPGYDICLPQGNRLCRVVYNGVVVETREPLVAWTCALNKLVISECPFQFQQAQCWYPDGEDVARRAMRMFEAGTTQFRLILHQAGFGPTVVHVGYFDLAQPELLRGLFPVELRQVALEYLKFLEVDDFHFIVHPSGVPRRPHVFILQWLDDSQDFVDPMYGVVVEYGDLSALSDVVERVASRVGMTNGDIEILQHGSLIRRIDEFEDGAILMWRLCGRLDVDDVSLMQRPAEPLDESDLSSDFSDERLKYHVYRYDDDVMEIDVPHRRVFARRTLCLLEMEQPAWDVYKWASLLSPLLAPMSQYSDILIEIPRQEGTVDFLVEFVHAVTQQALEVPKVYRAVTPVARDVFIEHLLEHYGIDERRFADAVLWNGQVWPAMDSGRKDLRDGDVVTVLLLEGSDDESACSDSTMARSSRSTSSEVSDMCVLTMLLPGERGEDDRIDVVYPREGGAKGATQRFLFGAKAWTGCLCTASRKHPDQQNRQLLGVGSVTTIPSNQVLALVLEMGGVAGICLWHVATLPSQPLKNEFKSLVARSGTVDPGKIFSQYGHPQDPTRLQLPNGAVLRLDIMPDSEVTDDIALLQSSLLGTSLKSLPVSTGYTEANLDLRSVLGSGSDVTQLYQQCQGCHVGQPSRSLTVVPPDDTGYVDDRIVSLRHILAELRRPWPAGSMTARYDAIPHLHPFAVAASQLPCNFDVGHDLKRCHIFTDGSATKGDDKAASWAFHLVLESGSGPGRHYARVAFTGSLLQNDEVSHKGDALDAEAMALIYVADWLLTQPPGTDYVIHSDAVNAGLGAVGKQRVSHSDGEVREVQKFSRNMMALAQAVHPTLVWVHVHAHKGQPDNEMVDCVAFALTHGWDIPCKPPWRLAPLRHPLVDWAWIEVAPTVEIPGLVDLLRIQPADRCLRHEYFDIRQSRRQADDSKQVKWKFGTVNVRTMEYGGDIFSHKQNVIQHQAKDFAFDVLALQECRGRHDAFHDDVHFLRVAAAARQGRGGLELWFRKFGSFCDTGCGDITKEDLVVWHTDHRVLAVSCLHPALRCDFIAFYAPQRGLGPELIEEWWTSFAGIVQQRPLQGQVVLLGDANARVGSVTSPGIQDLAADLEDMGGAHLRALCDRWELCLPCTFPDWHRGPTHTFISARAGVSRVDFIAVPLEWRDGIESSWICGDFDLLNDELDHSVVALQVDMVVGACRHKYDGRAPLYDRDAARSDAGAQQASAFMESIPPIPWEVDVNDHWQCFRSALGNMCQRHFPLQKRKRRQLYLSDDSWRLVCARKDLQIDIKRCIRGQKANYLAFCFAAWCGRWQACESVACNIALTDAQIALDVWERVTLGDRFKQLRKEERRQWALSCAATFTDNLGRQPVAQWYKLVAPRRAVKHKTQTKARLPGMKDEQGRWITQGHAISMMWQRHFGGIEHACVATADDILEASQPNDGVYTLDMLMHSPTLFDLEQSLRDMDVRKATGPDQLGAELWRHDLPVAAKRSFPMLLKSSLRQQWIAEMAGGDLVPLYKKGDPAQPSNYRAILLEPVLGRAFSRTWRSRLVQAISFIQAPQQYGGTRRVSIEIAHMLIRNAQRISVMRRRSCGLLFVDIQSAFYSLAKPLLSEDGKAPDAVLELFR